MKCKNCGYEFKGQNYCPICGEMDLINDDDKKVEKEDDPFEKIEKKDTVVNSSNYGPQYKVFAIIGYAIGIYSLVFFWVPFMFFGTIPGIVFSKIGDKPTNKQQFAKKGFAMSLAGVIINVIFTIVFFVVFGILVAEGIIEATN